jgi:hypothetical protein
MKHDIRIAAPADIETIMDIARQAYGDRDWVAARRWTEEALAGSSTPCFLGRRSFAFGLVQRMFWDPHPRGFLLFFAARRGSDLEPLAVLRRVAAWAASLGAPTLECGSETVYDLAPFLRRLAGRDPSRLERYELYRVRI